MSLMPRSLVLGFCTVALAALPLAVGAAEPQVAAMPSSTLAIPKEHTPKKYRFQTTELVNGKFHDHHIGTMTISIIEHKQGKATHAFKVETHDIESASDKAGAERPKSLWVRQHENKVSLVLFHQDADHDLVMDGMIGVNGKEEHMALEKEHFILPGNLQVGSKWLGDHPIGGELPGVQKYEAIGTQVENGVPCWVYTATHEPGQKVDAAWPNAETIRKETVFVHDPLTLDILRVSSKMSGVGPLGKNFEIYSITEPLSDKK